MKGILILSNKWDIRFLEMAKLVASWSKDPSTQVGAIAVRNRTVIAQGYNGFPRGMGDEPFKYEHKQLKYKMIVHAEMNLIYNAADNGVSLKDSTVYVVGLPACGECAKGLIQVGVKRVVMPERGHLDDKWAVSCADAQNFFDEAGVEWEWIKL